MRLLIDANILLDVLQNRQPHYMASSLIWKLCETKREEGYVSPLTFANLVYIMRKELTPERIEEIFGVLSLIFCFADFSAADIARAAEMKWNDFEDAVQSATAERIHADYIITRNVQDFRGSKVPALTPTDYLNGKR